MLWSNNNNKSTLVTSWPMVLAAGTAATALLVRAIRRALSPTHTTHLSCRCGQIQGTVTAKRQDSICIYCYCQDCRDYAHFIAERRGNQPDTTIGQPHGDNRVVQVCKSAVRIHQGREYMGLARKAPNDDKDNDDNDPKKTKRKKKKQLYMHRYYAKCCHVPLMNTVDFLGFVGIFVDALDNVEPFDGPVCMFPEQAVVDPQGREPDIWVPDFLWKLVRYLPWRKAGPFDYDLEPVYWGGQEQDG